jgi:hypothetical protein
MATEDPFYVGYLPLPKSLKRFVMLFAGIWILGMVGFAALLASNQQDPGSGVSDTSTTRLVEGYLTVDPYPLLHVSDPDSPSGTRSILLVSAFKFGASKRVAEFVGQNVEVTGHFIRRKGRAAFELVNEEAIRHTDNQQTAFRITAMGDVSLVGEITDSKCFLGVMKPGFGKTHRACAVRCIAGGIPPILVTRDQSGKATVFLLTDSRGGPVNELVLPYVAESVEIKGSLEVRGDMPVIKIDADGILRK